MHFHLPKPLHGWREFVGEVAIIVMGILIALGAEELVQQHHWAEQVREARESMDEQLAGAKFNSLERIQYADCIARRLDRLDQLIEAPELPPLPSFRPAGLREWSTSTWDAASSSGVAAHLDPATRNLYAGAFGFADLIGQMNRDEFKLWADLGTAQTHRRLDPVSRDRLARDIASARALNNMIKLGSQQWLEGTKALNLELDAESKVALREPITCSLPDEVPPTKAVSAPAAP